jgi:hypothetical protein
MIRSLAVITLLAGGTGMAAPLWADEPPPGTGDPRFVFHRSDTAFMRLDLDSGQIVACTERDDEWVCTAVPDERAVLGGEIARLRRENALLRSALLARGVPLPQGLEVQPAASPPTALPQTAPSPVAPSAATVAPQPPGDPPSVRPVASQSPEVPPSPPPAVSQLPVAPPAAPPLASVPASPPSSAESERASREDAEIERVMNVMEKAWRRLVDMMINIQREMQKKS